jgi:thiamine biosynthesis lipoprotein ApbE
MGRVGINFIESLRGLEGYMVDKDGIGTETSGLGKYFKNF